MKRIQRQRTRGWRMPEGAVYVGRPTKWGNPFRLDGPGGREAAVGMYRAWLANETWYESAAGLRLAIPWAALPPPPDIAPLRDATALACWCPLVDAEGRPVPCHADVLLELLADGR